VDDVIGTAPDPQRRRRPLRRPALPGGRRAPRAVGVAVALAAAAGVVGLSRAGLDDGATPAAGAGLPVPVQGAMLRFAAGQDTVYALIEDCRAPQPCRVVLVASGNDGRTWRELPMPGGRTTEQVALSWRLEVSGPEDQLSIEDPAAGVVRFGVGSFVTRKLVAGPAVARVPANREALTRLCARPRCPRPTVEFLDPRTGVRSPLAVQPPFPPRLVAVEGAQLWAAGVDPRTRAWAVAVSTDDGGTWRSSPLPTVPTDPAYAARLVPAPEQQQAYLLLEQPGDPPRTVYGVWLVPDPATGAAPRLVRPEHRLLQLADALGLRDGRLALAGGAPAVLAPDGVVDLLEVASPNAPIPPHPVGALQRGPHGQVIADGASADGVGIVVSPSGDPNSWEQRLVRLPPR
jgi:hypothetical protein